MYEIHDEDGLIHSGTLEEMSEAWDIMTRDIYSLDEHDECSEAFQKYHCKWNGDLKLVHVIRITK